MLLPISALQHYAYCPRQFALIHIEQVWAENRHTAEGRVLHERVDSGEAEQRGRKRYERAVQLHSETYQLIGKMDLLEIEEVDAGTALRYLPVEYKRGKTKVEDWDRIQLCAQALCLEEMRSISIHQGALWYWQERRRETVDIDTHLRRITQQTIEVAHAIYVAGTTPPPIKEKKRCRACSLVDICQPNAFTKDRTTDYIADLLSDEA